jgi:hypothetical protein
VGCPCHCLVHDVTACKREVYSTAWGLLQRLCDATGRLKLLPGVPEAREDNELASFSHKGAVFEWAAVSGAGDVRFMQSVLDTSI